MVPSGNMARDCLRSAELPVRADLPATRRDLFLPAAILLGLGLGGFFDGIVLHQILQWHHMVSTPTPPDTLENLELNTLGDGLFHAATWIMTLAGVMLLLIANGDRERPDARRRFLGGLLIGWGLFDVVEGVIDHHILNLHHVRPGPNEALYDYAFLAWGTAMLVVGWWLTRRTDTVSYARPVE
jgi:uncharacterized membrane protein